MVRVRADAMQEAGPIRTGTHCGCSTYSVSSVEPRFTREPPLTPLTPYDHSCKPLVRLSSRATNICAHPHWCKDTGPNRSKLEGACSNRFCSCGRLGILLNAAVDVGSVTLHHLVQGFLPQFCHFVSDDAHHQSIWDVSSGRKRK